MQLKMEDRLCTAERDYFQKWGKPARELKPSDLINILAKVNKSHNIAKTVGLHILPFKFLDKTQGMNGLKQ